MTKKELANLHERQRSNPTTEIIETALESLLQIGSPAGIPKICSFDDMLYLIILSPDVIEKDKRSALRIYRNWSYASGMREERRKACSELKISWYEGKPKRG